MSTVARPGPPPTRPARVRRLRRAAVAVLVVVLLLLVAVAGIGWYFSGIAVALGSHDFRPDATVRSVDVATIRLSSTDSTREPGDAALEWAGGYGRLGAVLATGPDDVTRAFTPVTGRPAPGTSVQVDIFEPRSDPRTALGLAFTDVGLPGELGALPTWYVPATSSQGTWAVFAHGHDSSRQESLRYLALLHERGLPVLVPSYRNDVGAPASPDGQQHLGDTEWRDLEPAVRFALDHGARDVVLLGWSMGGALALQFVDRSPLRGRVRGLVLDSPVVDWGDVLQHQARMRHLPDAVTWVAQRFVGERLGIDLGRLDWAARARELHTPVLLVHSDADDFVPDGPSKALARARPELVTYVDIPGAGHTRGWNVDPKRYRAALLDWFGREGV